MLSARTHIYCFHPNQYISKSPLNLISLFCRALSSSHRYCSSWSRSHRSCVLSWSGFSKHFVVLLRLLHIDIAVHGPGPVDLAFFLEAASANPLLFCLSFRSSNIYFPRRRIVGSAVTTSNNNYIPTWINAMLSEMLCQIKEPLPRFQNISCWYDARQICLYWHELHFCKIDRAVPRLLAMSTWHGLPHTGHSSNSSHWQDFNTRNFSPCW